MDKKGSLLDTMQIGILLFAMGLIIIISAYLINTFDTEAGDMLSSPEAQNALDKGKTTLQNFDGLFAFILIGLILATMIGAYFIQTSPAIFWISTILLVIFLTISGIFSNVYSS